LLPEQSIQTDTATSTAFLREITHGWSALPEPVALELRCLMPERTPDISRFGHDEAGIAALVQHASAMNAAGLNCYIVVNPVRASAPLRRDGKLSGAMDEDIPAAFYFWADGDDEQAAHSIRNFAGPKYTMAVMTGTVPSPRPHVYWRCADGPMYDLAQWTVIQRGIARVLSTDRTVVNPSRIMRLPGTINIPTKAKALKGRVPELTTFRSEYPDARPPVTLEQMQRVFGAEVPQALSASLLDLNTAEQRKTADHYADILRRCRTDGEKHGGVRDLSAFLAGSGVARAAAEAMVREACPVWDRGVEALIDTAYEKFYAPPLHAAQPSSFDVPAEAAWPTAYDMFDEASLAPRQWVYGKHYLRRFVSVLASAGGVGKTSMQIVEALAICTGRPLLGEKVEEQCNVWLINLEDPMDEMQRRILAAMRHYGIKPEEVRGKLFVDAGRDFSLNFAIQTREGITANTALVEYLNKRIPERKIGAVFIDPFVGAHQINENDNMAVNAVVAQIRQVADETNCAIGLVHHIRKGNGEDATIDSVRGAGSLIGAARAARVINKISEQDALNLGVDPKEAQGLFRVDDGKANLAPPASAAVFRRMEGVQIGNGEWVGVAVPFVLPDEWDGMTPDTTNEILRIIDLGIPDAEGNEEYYSARPQDKDRWVGGVIISYAFDDPAHAKNAAQAKRIVSQWFKTGLLEDFEYRSVKQRKDRKGVRSTGRVGEQR
jgi:hypothetical protein